MDRIEDAIDTSRLLSYQEKEQKIIFHQVRESSCKAVKDAVRVKKDEYAESRHRLKEYQANI